MPQTAADSLKAYKQKRDFKLTPEPRGKLKPGKGRLYVIQKHDATRLHYDFRLELDGVLKSWAVTKGPSINPNDKRLAVHVEDHPLDYAEFEGTIPKGQYGGGTVMLWDIGTWTPEGDPHEGLRKGKLSFTLDGERLKGGFTLVRMRFDRNGRSKRENWLLIKRSDEESSENTDPTTKYETSVKSDRNMAAIAKGNKVWHSNRTSKEAKPKKTRQEKVGQPAFVPPQLALLKDEPPEGKNWIHEIKFDGYRLIASLAHDSVKLFTRSGKDWTAKFGSLETAFAKLDLHALIDGEAVVYDTAGRSSFQALQKALSEGDDAAIKFVAFDLLFFDGVDLRRQPLEERKKKLKALLRHAPAAIAYSEHLPGTVQNVLEHACKIGAEGLVSKDRHSAYVSRRDASWIKSKCTGRSEFVIGGYRPSDKKSRSFASLLIGENGPDGLIYRGRVGTGFDEDGLAEIGAELRAREVKSSPFIKVPRDIVRRAKWVKPELVAEIAFTEMTSDGHMRHPVFIGLREDKAAKEVTGADRSGVKPMSEEEGEHAGVRLTHPERVFYPADGVTKQQLAAYLEKAAPKMLPFVARHPLSLVRCPDGIASKCFFQKHVSAGMPPAFKAVPIREKDGGKEDYLYVDSAEGIISAAQIGALELHVWGSPIDDIEHPDRMVFDLDPSPEVDFKAVREAARDVAAVLKKAGLESVPLVTGGKGVHVIVPLSGKNDWEDVKGFASNFAKGLAIAAPDRFIATASKEKRKGLIFIDWLRNERGATAIAPYSPRARKGAAVAVPLSWNELARTRSASAFNTKNAIARLKKDPWPSWKKKQTISRQAIAAAEAAAAK